ncbi:hypothetical protein MBLNU457_6976t1 [Dothideomycetes sp. NU457]
MPLFSFFSSATAPNPNISPPLPSGPKPSDTWTTTKSDAEQLEEQLRKTISVVRAIEEKETAKVEMAKRNTELEQQNRLLTQDMKELNEDIWTLEKRLAASEMRNKVIDGLYMAEKAQREQDGIQHKTAVDTNRERYQQLLYEKKELADRNRELEKRCARLQRYEQMIVKCGQVALVDNPRKRKRSNVDDEAGSEDMGDDVVPSIEEPQHIADDDESASDALVGNDAASVSSTVCNMISRLRTEANSGRYSELLNDLIN